MHKNDHLAFAGSLYDFLVHDFIRKQHFPDAFFLGDANIDLFERNGPVGRVKVVQVLLFDS